jgi:hypothetical protein
VYRKFTRFREGLEMIYYKLIKNKHKRYWWWPFIVLVSVFVLNPLISSAEEPKSDPMHQDQLSSIERETDNYTKEQIANILQTAQMAIDSSQNAVTGVQTIATLLSFFIGALGIISFIAVLLFRQRVEKLYSSSQILEKKVEKISTSETALRSSFEKIEGKGIEIEKSLKSFEDAKNILSNQYKQISIVSEALHAVFELGDPDDGIRLGHLQRLSQLIHPVGILRMIEILGNPSENLAMRSEAAFGLGRFSENKDLSIFWGQILNCLQRVLQDKNLPTPVVIEAVKSAAKFGS